MISLSELCAIVRPPALHPGESVAVIAPAGPVDPDALKSGCDGLAAMGYRPVFLPSILDRNWYFAGSVQRRLDELHEMFRREDIRAIICARGGYGCNYLLAGLDLDLIRANPKAFVGYSDVTALLTYITDATGLVTFHGPMVAKDFAHRDGVSVESWQATVGGQGSFARTFNSDVVSAMVKGRAQGRLYGGCLSILVASLGTPYEIQTEGTILFIEDIAARPYQVDRMLMQLKLAGKLDRVLGIAFGEFCECDAAEGSDFTLQDVITRIVGNMGIPVCYGIRSGHVCGENMTLPIGLQTTLDVAEQVTLSWN